MDKKREIFTSRNVRIHLDNVKGLGKYLEFEVIFNSINTARKTLDKLIGHFKLDESAFIRGSYSDLKIKRNNKMPTKKLISRDVQHVTTKVLQLMKDNYEKITMLTCYDYLTAKFLDAAKIELILVGDSLSNVIQGNETTLPVTLDEMIYHTSIVRKGVERAMVIADMIL